jgi:hypothetical protein
MRSRTHLTLITAAVLLGVAAPCAAADGLPVPVDQAFGEGVVSADGDSRFVTIDTGPQTVVLQTSTADGKLTNHTVIDGNYTVPAIAVDGTASGISADGQTLALITPRRTFPRTETQLVVYDVERRIKNAQRIELDGDFSYDALSPDGETMYLVEYTNPRDPGSYQVRALDIATRELDPDPILDSEEEPGDMRGLPQTRVTSPDGSWEYTLYDGGGGEPFIHALDVVDAVTVCIDLEVRPKDTYGASLVMSEDGGEIEVAGQGGEVLAVVDTESNTAHEPGEEPEAAAAPAEPDDSGPALAGIAVGGALIALLAAIGFRRSREGRE